MPNKSSQFRVLRREGRTVIEFLQSQFSERELAECGEALKKIVSQCASRGDAAVCFDLCNLLVCPSGLMAILVWLRRFAPVIQLINVSDPVLESLTTTQLDQFFDIPQLM